MKWISWLWDLLYRLPICHPLPDRSRLFGVDLPLCCRCSGIYSFIVIGIVANHFLKLTDIHQNKRLVAFVLLSLVTGVEACAEIIFNIDLGNGIRLLTGAVSGFAIGVLFFAGVSGIKAAPGKRPS
jgi:uncharacterized membrane protein